MLAISTNQGWPVMLFSTFGTLFLLFVQQKCQNIAKKCSISLILRMQGWAIPQINRMVHQIRSDKNN